MTGEFSLLDPDLFHDLFQHKNDVIPSLVVNQIPILPKFPNESFIIGQGLLGDPFSRNPNRFPWRFIKMLIVGVNQSGMICSGEQTVVIYTLKGQTRAELGSKLLVSNTDSLVVRDRRHLVLRRDPATIFTDQLQFRDARQVPSNYPIEIRFSIGFKDLPKNPISIFKIFFF